MFPFGDHAQPSRRFDHLRDQIQFRAPDEERAARLKLVPKTLKTPRVICIEPVCMQYVQQGIMEKLVDYLEDSVVLSGMIGFRDQTPNQRMARDGSLTGSLATLDLSEASDRVSNQHVRVMLHRYPFVWRGVDACRTRKVEIRELGTTIELAKFASMGSALCFPMEAMVFLTVAFIGIEKALDRQLTMKDVKSLHGMVRVYGDDILVPTDYARDVVSALEAFGFKVNTNKSFWTGMFRESCGAEYYQGADVSVVRMRRLFPKGRRLDRKKPHRDAREIISLVVLRNQLFMRGLHGTAEYLDEVIVRFLGRNRFPRMVPDFSSVSYTGDPATGSPLLGRFVYDDPTVDLQDSDWHTPMVLGYVAKAILPKSTASGEAALLKAFLKRGDEPYPDREHLMRYGRPKDVSIALRKVPVRNWR
jgi:hypothetical protein